MSPMFPYITDFKKIIKKSQSFVDEYWFENLNLRGYIFFKRSMSLIINLDFVEILKKQSHLTNSSNIFLVILYSLSNSL